ncbi:hypothetical protein RhiirA1_482631 [Rhizophagus irregularis]|uniref:Uncharacterized protein n=1 Tax=Rhizophagus irregularis TaxID=588596 RepID=A0A2N0QLK7_9GLOM|nr:hypothetical protein RhiirA1_482631 [Rhizophagus irregularis]
MSHNTENFVTHNPFEGENGASMRNQAIDAGVGFTASFVFFALMFIIAVVIVLICKRPLLTITSIVPSTAVFNVFKPNERNLSITSIWGCP